MAKIRLVMLSMLAVVAVGAIASASASAAECKQGTEKKFAFCVGSAKTLTEGKEFDIDVASSGENVLEAAGITIKCPKILETLTLLTAEKGVVKFNKFQLHFVECAVTVGEHCVLESALILTEPLNGLAIAKKEVKFYPESGTQFATITILSSGGTCLVAGKDKVVAKEGKAEEGPLCGVPTAETPATSHLVECGGKASNLKFAGKEATFKGNFTATYLAAGKATEYSFIEGT